MVHYLLRRRAHALVRRVTPFLKSDDHLLDIGCGTGHNAAALKERFPLLKFREADVADMKMVGPPPVILNSYRWPFEDDSFDAALVLFVLHYSSDPVRLLREARRVTARSLIIMQSTFEDAWSKKVLRLREWSQGRGAFRAAAAIRMVQGSGESLRPVTFFDRPRLVETFAAAGWRVAAHQPQYWPMTSISRDLFVLEKA
jgi:ubiquinone/menaquinone biosynthesis C-methylase UbiE